MAATLKNLCKYARENYGMNLICGESNMNNLVNWVHMLEDPETAGFLHGQELIFSTGIGHRNTEWLLEFAKGLVEHQASGLVLNIGPYIESVPEDLIRFCREVRFPLFTIPWKTRIVDITNDFCRKIIKSEENEVTVASAFRNAIFFPEQGAEYRPVLERREFDLETDFCVLAISIRGISNEDYPEYDKIVRLKFTRIFVNHSDRFNIFRQDKNLIAVLQNFDPDFIEKAVDTLHEELKYGYPDCKINIGISFNGQGITSLARNYKRATALARIAEKQDKVKLSYQNIGLYQLLIEVEDPKALRKFYEDTLGKLESYDLKYKTDYVATLKNYLDNNASVQEVAKETFVHRNTINYKIKKIKELLQSELNYQDGLKLLLAYYVRELL
ncbi:transcriptional regulator, PucR family [Syntrophobotulus glycolicus DSM 8271]|uniref:Transcriptional regulator, PucR family n=1 Tax=Syntrophobotulus glycolicus (strain DSM 8271 / FlGlyR) TaxID=645991 RepID=F0SVX1_SYNGF|nr:PucR family transcriptional regulator [Syntrophobotulus glycolicus]ADY55677.1 transcriptional regulator, PucR family [Syntrophobotulus glycolicus DSM 8271]